MANLCELNGDFHVQFRIVRHDHIVQDFRSLNIPSSGRIKKAQFKQSAGQGRANMEMTGVVIHLNRLQGCFDDLCVKNIETRGLHQFLAAGNCQPTLLLHTGKILGKETLELFLKLGVPVLMVQ